MGALISKGVAGKIFGLKRSVRLLRSFVWSYPGCRRCEAKSILSSLLFLVVIELEARIQKARAAFAGLQNI